MRNVPSAFRANLAIAAAIASACFGCARSAIRLKDASIDRLGKSSDSADRSADVGGAGGIDGGVSGLDGAAGESSSQAKDALVEWTGDSAADFAGTEAGAGGADSGASGLNSEVGENGVAWTRSA